MSGHVHQTAGGMHMRHTHAPRDMVEQITVPIIKIWDSLSPDHLGESNSVRQEGGGGGRGFTDGI